MGIIINDKTYSTLCKQERKIRSAKNNRDKLYESITEDSFINVDRFNLYRIVQEVLNNALKHSQADQISITIKALSNGKISLVVIDNGLGFDAEGTSEGLGMQNMKHIYLNYRMLISNF